MRGLDADDLALYVYLVVWFLVRTCLQLGGLVGMLLSIYIKFST